MVVTIKKKTNKKEKRKNKEKFLLHGAGHPTRQASTYTHNTHTLDLVLNDICMDGAFFRRGAYYQRRGNGISLLVCYFFLHAGRGEEGVYYIVVLCVSGVWSSPPPPLSPPGRFILGLLLLPLLPPLLTGQIAREQGMSRALLCLLAQPLAEKTECARFIFWILCFNYFGTKTFFFFFILVLSRIL